MKATFHKSPTYATDCFVVDYSEYCRIRRIQPARKVEVTDQTPTIEHMHLQNPKKLPMLAVNLEHYSHYQAAQNCEALLVCQSDTAKPWALLVELKYCSPRNYEELTIQQSITRNGQKALSQVLATARTLKASPGLDGYTLYGNIALMWLNVAEPYTTWLTQDDLLKIKEDTGLTILSYQTLVTRHPRQILAKPKRIHT